MPSNRGVAYIKPGTVEVKSIDYPKLRMPKSETDPFGGKDAPHGVILKIVTRISAAPINTWSAGGRPRLPGSS
jgi:hypothetical protein